MHVACHIESMPDLTCGAGVNSDAGNNAKATDPFQGQIKIAGGFCFRRSAIANYTSPLARHHRADSGLGEKATTRLQRHKLYRHGLLLMAILRSFINCSATEAFSESPPNCLQRYATGTLVFRQGRRILSSCGFWAFDQSQVVPHST